jgi:hypothetical protein
MAALTHASFSAARSIGLTRVIVSARVAESTTHFNVGVDLFCTNRKLLLASEWQLWIDSAQNRQGLQL